MKAIKFLICLAILNISLASNAALNFPLRATVSSNSVNVRAGFSNNFESLMQLDENTSVTVVGKEYSWYKVILPKNASCYIDKDYIEILDANQGVVIANRVNVRAKPNTKSSVVGQLARDTLVEVRKVDDGWAEIVPNSACFGWINIRYLKLLDETATIEPLNKYKSPLAASGSGEITPKGKP